MYGRAECVLSLLRAGADIYAADSQGRTSLELLTKLKNMCRSLTVPQPDLASWIMLTLPPTLQRTPTGAGCVTGSFGAGNYKHVLAYVENADADCQRRSRGQTLNYQGVVVVHPGGELGLVPC